MSSPLLSWSKLAGFGVGAVLLVLAVAVSGILYATRPRPEQRSLSTIVPRVVVIPLDRIPVHPHFQGFGVASAFTRADVPSRISSTVIEVPATTMAGSVVTPGQILVVLDDSDAQRQLDSATQQIAGLDAQLAQLKTEEASLIEQARLAEEDAALARIDLERVRSASAEGAAREREVDRARQAVLVAERLAVTLNERAKAAPARRSGLMAARAGQQAAQRQAATDVDRCRITAPVGGVIQRFDLKPGEMVKAGEIVARIIDASRMEVPLQLPAGVRPMVRVGDPVELRSTDRRERVWSATVARIAPEDDQRNRTFTVWAELQQDPMAPEAVAPGMFLEAIVSSATAQLLTVIPRRAIRGDRIFVVTDGIVNHVDIVEAFSVSGPYPGAPVADREWVAVRGDPPAGTIVVLDAARVLPDGGRVNGVPPATVAVDAGPAR